MHALRTHVRSTDLLQLTITSSVAVSSTVSHQSQRCTPARNRHGLHRTGHRLSADLRFTSRRIQPTPRVPAHQSPISPLAVGSASQRDPTPSGPSHGVWGPNPTGGHRRPKCEPIRRSAAPASCWMKEKQACTSHHKSGFAPIGCSSELGQPRSPPLARRLVNPSASVHPTVLVRLDARSLSREKKRKVNGHAHALRNLIREMKKCL